jgi:hypothetical protein
VSSVVDHSNKEAYRKLAYEIVKLLRDSTSMKVEVNLTIRALPHDVARLSGKRLAEKVWTSGNGEPDESRRCADCKKRSR